MSFALTQTQLADMTPAQKIVAGLRLKLRFTPEAGGRIAIEDLYDIPLTHRTKANLDELAIALQRKIKESCEESFVKQNKTDVKTLLAFDIVKHIIEVRVAESDAAKKAADRKAEEQKLMALIDQKENEELTSKSADELREQLKVLRAETATPAPA